MVISETIENLIMEKAPASKLRDTAIEEGMVSLELDAINKLKLEIINFMTIKPLLMNKVSR